jgi:POT family proton-dependent oligopeptide transporter
VANFIVGWLGSLYEHIGALQFWALHAAIAGAGGLLALVFRGRLERILAGADAEDQRA